MLENLSKLLFSRPENRLPSNISGFVGYILTGGACLIIRNSIYHGDIAASIQLLANEIKCLFGRLSAKNQPKLVWDQALFEKFVDYEADILIHILQLQGACQELEIIATPSYLVNYDPAKQLEQELLPWLQTRTKILEAYNINTHSIVIWAFSGNKLSAINGILKSIPKNKINPYLRLGLMLRAASINKASLRWLVEISDFENLEQSGLFKNVAIQTALLIIETKINIPPAFWQILLEFYTVLQEPEIKKLLIKKSINELFDEYQEYKNLNLLKLKKIVHRLNEDKFEKEIDNLFVRQQECLKFLLTFNNKVSKKIVKKIKDQMALRKQLELIADSCMLVPEKLSEEFFFHIKTLVTDKEINKLIKLESLFNFDFQCFECRQNIYKFSIPHVAEKLKLDFVAVPEILTFENEQQHYKKLLPKSSILSQPDPFIILDVCFADSKQTIMQKVMKLIREAPDKMAIFRQAQSSLFDLAQRFVHRYFRYLSYEEASAVVEFCQSPIDIPFRDQFLNEK